MSGSIYPPGFRSRITMGKTWPKPITKFTLRHHPPPQTFLNDRNVQGASNLVCKLYSQKKDNPTSLGTPFNPIVVGERFKIITQDLYSNPKSFQA